MSRTDNIRNNLIFNIIKFATQMVLQFVLRTALIYLMGAEYIGLNGLFTNIFSFLNLAELGIGSAIVFSMYKPIADGDTEKVKSLQALYKKFYSIISLIVVALGIMILPFINFFIDGEVTVDINIYLLYILYLINTLVGYFSAHKRSLLFAHQRNDVENKVRSICIFGMTIIQILVLFIFRDYYIYFIVNIIFTILECILIHLYANNLYPEINGKSNPLDDKTKKEITKNITALSMHKIGGVIVFSTDNIIISTLLGITILGAYSNYYLIITSLISMFALFINALTGSVGNLIASKDTEYAYKKYKQINLLFSLLSAFTTICLIVLFQPFINVWTGGGVYLLDYSTVILICISYYVNRMRSGTSIFKDGAGIFWQNRLSPIFEAIINLIISIGLGMHLGINGVVIGTIVSTLIAPFWVEPKVLYKHYFKRSVWEYFRRYILDVIIMVAVGFACYFVCSFIPDGGILWLIVKFSVCIILCVVLLILAYLPTKEFQETLCLVKSFLKSFIK